MPAAEQHKDITIRVLDAAEATTRIDELIAILRDSVEGGASMNFLEQVTDEELGDFWRQAITDVAMGGRALLVADDARRPTARIVGTAMLIYSNKQNSPHRAEVGKMIVHRSARRRRLGVRLLEAVEVTALEHGRTLLLLDTETDSPGERLYEACGWTRFGIVPDHAYTPDGVPKPTSFFYKQLTAP
jgi:GNAT superfamily N-acetyltransferase